MASTAAQRPPRSSVDKTESITSSFDLRRPHNKNSLFANREHSHLRLVQIRRARAIRTFPQRSGARKTNASVRIHLSKITERYFIQWNPSKRLADRSSPIIESAAQCTNRTDSGAGMRRRCAGKREAIKTKMD